MNKAAMSRDELSRCNLVKICGFINMRQWRTWSQIITSSDLHNHP
jgi:hypothetical protein